MIRARLMRTMRLYATTILLAGAAAAVIAGASASGSAKKLSESTVRWGGVGGTYEGMLFIAQDKGYFKQEGINIQRILLSGGVAISAGLASGSLDISNLGVQEIIVSQHRGIKQIGIGISGRGPNEFGVISSEWAQKTGIRESSSFAAQMRALKGARVGLGAPGSTTTVVALMTLKQFGLTPGRDLEIINLGSGPAMVAAFRQGRIDAFFWLPPLTHTVGGVLVDFRKSPVWQGINWQAWTTTSKFINDHPDTVQAFVRAMVKAWQFAMTHPAEAAQITQKNLPHIPAASFLPAFKVDYDSWHDGLLFDSFGYRKAVSVASTVLEQGLGVPMSQAATNEFVLKAGQRLNISVGPAAAGLWRGRANGRLYRWRTVGRDFEARSMTSHKLKNGCLVRAGDVVNSYHPSQTNNLYKVGYRYWRARAGGPGARGTNCTKYWKVWWKAPQATTRIIVSGDRMTMTLACNNKREQEEVCYMYRRIGTK